MKKINKVKFIKNFNFNNTNHVYANILCGKNNTIINVGKKNGDTLIWGSCVSIGLKGFKKTNIYSAQKTAEVIGKKLFSSGVKFINIFVKGIGYGRDPSIRGFYNSGLKINTISDITPIPHNGCRGKKMRRL